MQVKNESQTKFAKELSIVPAWAWMLAGIAFITAQIFFNIALGRQSDAPPAWGRLLLGLLAGIVFGFYLVLVGYISRDARRRSMSSVLWTLVAIVIPNGLGIIVYFILRQPLRMTCPQCGSGVQSGFNFCPHCRYTLSSNCPQCQRLVGLTDIYCAYCGTSLRHNATPELSTQLPA